MLTRRTFQALVVFLGAAAFPLRARSQQGGTVTIRIRVDDSVRQSIPPIVQQNLRIELDQSEDASELIRRSPTGRAIPIMFLIAGAMAIPVILQMMREALRQIYYGGLLIDMRSQPPNVTSNPKIPANMVFVIDGDGKMSRFTSDQLSPELLVSIFKAK